MNIFEHDEFDDHEEVVFFNDSASRLRSIIAIHDTSLGPALGGVRMFPYADSAEALRDVLRLSRGMTYKSALAGLHLGGGKAVVIGDPRQDKSPALFRAMGRCIDRLGGRYIAAEDSGTSLDDVRIMAETTEHVSGIAEKEDALGLPNTGDPSPWTAYGCLIAIRTAVRHALGRNDLAGVSVAIQGVGNVGRNLADQLKAEGASLTLADVHADAVAPVARRTGARIVSSDEIFGLDVDVFAPCALGAVINDRSIEQLKARVVAGAANNQLESPQHGETLHRRGILYAPDYVTNAGGVIDVAHERSGYDPQAVKAHVERIGDTLAEIFTRASASNRPTSEIADELARARIAVAHKPLHEAA